MMRFRSIVLLLVAFFATVKIAFSQSYVLSPNDTVFQRGNMEDLATLSIQQFNISENNIVLKWKKLYVSVPSNWEASVCDNSVCNTTLVDSGRMNPIDSGNYGLLLIHVTPHVNYGLAVVRYLLWNVSFPNNADTLTYILEVSPVSELIVNKMRPFSIYPNPSNDKINIISSLESEMRYSLNDISGKEILNVTAIGHSFSINSANLNNGLYNLIIFSNNGAIQTEKIHVQH